jgi:hypothetical protein
MRGVIATVLLAWVAQLPPAAPLPRDGVSRDTSATPAATGIIRGRVSDRTRLAKVAGRIIFEGGAPKKSNAPRRCRQKH